MAEAEIRNGEGGSASKSQAKVQPPGPNAERQAERPEWEVLATSATVEYFHTGNLADVLSASPWTEENETAPSSFGGANPLLVPPPEDLSVSLYLKSDPDETVVVVAVPRWFSNGEVWEVRFTHHSGLGSNAAQCCAYPYLVMFCSPRIHWVEECEGLHLPDGG